MVQRFLSSTLAASPLISYVSLPQSSYTSNILLCASGRTLSLWIWEKLPNSPKTTGRSMMLNTNVITETCIFPGFSFPIFWFFFLPIPLPEPAWFFFFLFWQMGKRKVCYIFSSNTYKRCIKRWAEIRAALLTLLSGSSVYRLFLHWHLRRGWGKDQCGLVLNCLGMLKVEERGMENCHDEVGTPLWK